MIEVTPGVRDYLLAFADDEHFMGQQYTEWIGVTPFLEEDLAFSSIGQDELGHAALLFALLAGDDDQAIDELAYQRDPSEYRSSWLTEFGSEDWAEAIVRHWLYDSIEQHRWELLAASSIQPLADVAARAQREETFHLRHANGILEPLLADPDARPRLLAALTTLLPLALGVFEPMDGEAEAVAAGVALAPLSDRMGPWKASVEQRFGPVEWPSQGPDQQGKTARSAPFPQFMSRLRQVLDYDPGATW